MRSASRGRGRRGRLDPRRRRRRPQPGVHLPEGVRAEGAARGSGPSARRRSFAGTASFARPTWDEAFAAIDAGLGPILEEGGRDAVAVYAGNPNAHNLAAMIYLRVFLRALGSKNVYSASSVDQMPKHFSAGHMFGHWTSIPVPGRRSHRPPDDLGREPAGLERQPPDRARHARANPPHPGARRQGRRDRPAAHPHRGAAPPSTTSSGPAPTRWRCSRWSRPCSRRGWPTRASWPASATGSTTSSGSRRSSRPSGSPTRAGSRRRAPPYGTRAGGGRARRRLRPDRHDGPGVRDARELARGRPERPLRELRPAGRRGVHEGGRGRSRTRPATPGTGTRRRRRALGEPGARPARGPRRAAGRPRSPRRSRRRARGRYAR